MTAKEIHSTESSVSILRFIQISPYRDSLIINDARKLPEDSGLDREQVIREYRTDLASP